MRPRLVAFALGLATLVSASAGAVTIIFPCATTDPALRPACDAIHTALQELLESAEIPDLVLLHRETVEGVLAEHEVPGSCASSLACARKAAQNLPVEEYLLLDVARDDAGFHGLVRLMRTSTSTQLAGVPLDGADAPALVAAVEARRVELIEMFTKQAISREGKPAAASPALPPSSLPRLRTPPRPGAPYVFAALSRGSCFGDCPIYRVRVFTDGRVEFEGVEFTRVRGLATASLTSAQLDALWAAFADAHFYELEGLDCRDVMDHPSVVLEFNDGQREKKMTHDLGCRRARNLARARKLEDAFETIVETQRWVGTDDERLQSSIVKFRSKPNGAALSVDGVLLCSTTPCAKPVGWGKHEVRLEFPGLATRQVTFTVPETVTLDLELAPAPSADH